MLGALCAATKKFGIGLLNCLVATLQLFCFFICKGKERAPEDKAGKALTARTAADVKEELEAANVNAESWRATVATGEPFAEDLGCYRGMPSGGTWKRAKDFLPLVNPGIPVSLFGQDGAKPMDLGQGRLGDCYLLASISALAEEPGRVEKLFANTEANEEPGRYAVFLFKDDHWITAEVDDRFWVSKDDNKPLCCNTKGTNKLWAMLLEKVRELPSAPRVDSLAPSAAPTRRPAARLAHHSSPPSPQAYCKLIFGGDWGKLGGGGQPFQALHHLRGMSGGQVSTDAISKTLRCARSCLARARIAAR